MTMRIRTIGRSVAVLVLAACTPVMEDGADQSPGFIEELPEKVVALAAPSQDLSAVRLRPDDGCYWYQHVGPVETTMLPLLTPDGRPICTRPAGSPPAG